LAILGMLLVNNIALDTATPRPLTHAPWNGGLYFADLVFPWFLLIVGVAIPYSAASALAKGLPSWRYDLKIVTRAATLVLLGCLIDSISIILLTVPIFAPIAMHLGFDPLAFAIMGILAIETGLLTPPFGILVFTVKSAVPDPNVELAEIFRGSIPYWIVLLGVVAALAAFPQLATFLPGL